MATFPPKSGTGPETRRQDLGARAALEHTGGKHQKMYSTVLTYVHFLPTSVSIGSMMTSSSGCLAQFYVLHFTNGIEIILSYFDVVSLEESEV